MAAVGFQKLANADPTRFQQQRLPVEVQLKDGRLHRVLIFPGDLAGALDTISGEAPGADELAALLQQAPFEFWAVEYSGFGDSVVIEAPSTERLLDLDDADECEARD